MDDTMSRAERFFAGKGVEFTRDEEGVTAEIAMQMRPGGERYDYLLWEFYQRTYILEQNDWRMLFVMLTL